MLWARMSNWCSVGFFPCSKMCFSPRLVQMVKLQTGLVWPTSGLPTAIYFIFVSSGMKFTPGVSSSWLPCTHISLTCIFSFFFDPSYSELMCIKFGGGNQSSYWWRYKLSVKLLMQVWTGINKDRKFTSESDSWFEAGNGAQLPGLCLNLTGYAGLFRE